MFPALLAVIIAVSAWVALAGNTERASQLRRDVPLAVFYGGNWGQILGVIPYFSGEAPLLRDLWSLAVEEQLYVACPVVLVALFSLRVP